MSTSVFMSSGTTGTSTSSIRSTAATPRELVTKAAERRYVAQVHRLAPGRFAARDQAPVDELHGDAGQRRSVRPDHRRTVPEPDVRGATLGDHAVVPGQQRLVVARALYLADVEGLAEPAQVLDVRGGPLVRHGLQAQRAGRRFLRSAYRHHDRNLVAG